MAARAASVAAADPRPELSAASREYREHGRHASRVLLSHGCKSELRAWEDCLSFVHRRPLGLARRDARMHADPGVHGLSTEDARSDALNSSTTMALIWDEDEQT